MNIVPFSHSHEREKVGLAELAELVGGEVPRVGMVPAPEFQVADEVGVFILEAGVGGVGGFLVI